MIRHLTAGWLLLLLSAAPAAAEERFTIQPAGIGPQRLELPPAFLSASAAGDLADLRLRGVDGAEVPYLLVPPPATPPRWATASRIRPIPPTKTESGAEIDLGTVRTVAGLELTFPDAGFLKKARVEGSADGRRWTVLAQEAVFYALPLDPAACGGAVCPGSLLRREVRFDAAAARLLRIVLDDRRSPRTRTPTAARALLAQDDAPAPGPSIPLAVTRREGEPGSSRFSLRLPGRHLPVRAVALEVNTDRLARRARVLEARLSGGRLAPVTLGSGALLVVERDGVLAAELRIPVSTPEELELELVVEDGDNPPLPLTAARAELEPLPWLFLESRDGSPVEARLGDPERRAPRYDLEALRPELGRLRPARATAAGPLAPVAEQAEPTATAAADIAGAGAPLGRAQFRYARVVPATPAGLVALRLDAEVLARSPSLADLRLAGKDGKQLPYLLEQRDEPLVMALEEKAGPAPGLPKGLERAGDTVHALYSPQPAFPEARLVLETSARVFTREVRVYVDPEQPHRHGPALVASASWAHADPDRPAPALTLSLPGLRATRLLVTVDDGDNAPLPLAAPRLLLPGYRLRFFHPGPAVELLYGASGLSAPRYDLALLAPRLRAAPARELALAPGASQDEPAAVEGSARLVFWGALGLTVLGLLALVVRLLVRGGGAPQPPA